ncbi:hypothetical protein QZH41_007775 [Actinostola sp. cb2023]|nr:hypothetical protein QZH41_007775 [Actinostola sp. cb2023]
MYQYQSPIVVQTSRRTASVSRHFVISRPLHDVDDNNPRFTDQCALRHLPRTLVPEATGAEASDSSFGLAPLESLLDRQEFLQWLLDVFEKGKASDDVLLKYLIPLVLRYVDQIVLSQTLARNLSHVCTKKLSTLYSAAEQMQSEQSAPSPQPTVTAKTTAVTGLPPSNTTNTNATESCVASQPVLSQYKSCPQHNSLVLALAAILQAVTISCPGALIWNSATLPGTQTNAAPNICISALAVHRVLSTLDILDKFNFNRAGSQNSADHLYSKIFPPVKDKHEKDDGSTHSIVNTIPVCQKVLYHFLDNYAPVVVEPLLTATSPQRPSL